MDLDLTLLPHQASCQPLFRPPWRGCHQPPTRQAELDARHLQRGGNAIDAAIATAAAYGAPTSNSISGDAFALVWDGAAGCRQFQGPQRTGSARTGLVRRHGHHDTDRGWPAVTIARLPAALARSPSIRFSQVRFTSLFRQAIFMQTWLSSLAPIASPNIGGTPLKRTAQS